MVILRRAYRPAGDPHSTGLGVNFMGGRCGVVEGVKLDEQAVDRGKLLLGDALAGDQSLQAVPPVAGRQKRAGGIECQRCSHHTLNVCDFLVEKADHGVSPVMDVACLSAFGTSLLAMFLMYDVLGLPLPVSFDRERCAASAWRRVASPTRRGDDCQEQRRRF